MGFAVSTEPPLNSFDQARHAATTEILAQADEAKAVESELLREGR